MINKKQLNEILGICEDLGLHIHRHDNESRKEFKLPLALYDLHPLFVVDSNGVVIFHGDDLMLHRFLTK